MENDENWKECIQVNVKAETPLNILKKNPVIKIFPWNFHQPWLNKTEFNCTQSHMQMYQSNISKINELYRIPVSRFEQESIAVVLSIQFSSIMIEFDSIELYLIPVSRFQ